MASLPDLSRRHATITIEGQPLIVRAISAAGIMQLLSRFPAFQEMMGARIPDAMKVTSQGLMQMIPDAIATVIALGLGRGDDPEELATTEAWATALNAEEQLAFLEAIIKLTMPAGVGPFVDRVLALVPDVPAPAVSGKASGTK